jgi:uncharacterized SAM-binding protein YcdF (DUF218 family)
VLAVLGYLAQVQHTVPPTPQAGHWPAGILFFADFDGHGDLGPESRDRVGHAAELFQAGRVGRLLCVGGRRASSDRYGAERMGEALVALGVPRGAIRVDRDSFDTRTNWVSAARMLGEGGWRDPLLIASALHLHRAVRLAPPGLDPTTAPTRTAFEALAADPLGTWVTVHREWVAWVADWLLPDDLHRHLVGRWRNFWDR